MRDQSDEALVRCASSKVTLPAPSRVISAHAFSAAVLTS